jgi:protein disulfide-isomerase
LNPQPIGDIIKSKKMGNWIKSLFITATIAVAASQSVQAQEVKDGLTWYTDINKVHELSVQTKKPVFAFFTGSDWCGWCHRLQAAVFSKPGFKTWAKQNVILLEVDFPRQKQLPDALAQQNQGLQQFFKVEGYPSIWMFYINKDKATGKYNISALGNLGYPQSAQGQEEATFLDNANKILKNKAS